VYDENINKVIEGLKLLQNVPTEVGEAGRLINDDSVPPRIRHAVLTALSISTRNADAFIKVVLALLEEHTAERVLRELDFPAGNVESGGEE